MNMQPSMKAVIKEIRMSADCLSVFATSVLLEGCTAEHRANMLESVQEAIGNIAYYGAELQRQLNVEVGK